MRGISFLFLSLSAFSQSELSVQVRSVPEGAPFLVDGERYTSVQFFSWKEGSRHTLMGVGDDVVKWLDSFGELGSIGQEVTVQATSEVTEYQASYTRQPIPAFAEKGRSLTASLLVESFFPNSPLLLWDVVHEDENSITLVASGLQPTDLFEVLVDREFIAPSDVSLLDGFVAIRIDRPDEGAKVQLYTADRISNALAISF